MNGHHGKDFSVEVFRAIEIGVVHANGFKIQISLVHEFRKPASLLIRRVGDLFFLFSGSFRLHIRPIEVLEQKRCVSVQY